MNTAAYFRDQAILITGASSGIGEEMARQLSAAGAKLTLAARRRDRLDALARSIGAAGYTEPLVVECDVTRDGDVERAVKESVRRWGKLDVAIANAGFALVGPLEKLTLDDYRRQFETNVFGVLRTTYAALPEIGKTKGHLVIVGSAAGWGATPGASAYSMSKFAVRAMADAITPELRASGVKVTLISPGFVASNIRRVDNHGELHADLKEPMPAWLVMGTDKAVRQMLRAIARGKREVIITGHAKVLVALQRFAPWVIRAATKPWAARGASYRSSPPAN